VTFSRKQISEAMKQAKEDNDNDRTIKYPQKRVISAANDLQKGASEIKLRY
jgi:hypothetical protein